MKSVKVTIDYPICKSFTVPASRSNKVKLHQLRAFLKNIKYRAPHVINDFVIEEIVHTTKGEFWVVGS